VIGWTISLGEVKKKIKVSILESLDKGMRILANLGSKSLIYLILENESQAHQFIGERAEHFGTKI